MSAPDPGTLNPRLMARQCNFIVAALIVGVLVFAGVALKINIGGPPKENVITWLAVAVGATLIPISVVIPKLFVQFTLKTLTHEKDPVTLVQRLSQLYLTKTILGAAAAEGGAFFNLVALIITGHWANLVMVGCLLATMIPKFTSQVYFEGWIKSRFDELGFST